MSEEQKISQRYRELPREEPPRHLDDAILVAARRATSSRPAPLVVPTGRRRWYFPVAAAAIIVLAVAVTVHVERQERDFETVEQQAASSAPQPEEPAAARDRVQPAPSTETPPLAELRKSQTLPSRPAAPPAAAPAPQSSEPLAGARESARADMRAERAVEQKALGLAAASPEQWLQGIADLKRQGRSEEAEKQLAEFRKRYPDYRIPEAILEKFEKR